MSKFYIIYTHTIQTSLTYDRFEPEIAVSPVAKDLVRQYVSCGMDLQFMFTLFS